MDMADTTYGGYDHLIADSQAMDEQTISILNDQAALSMSLKQQFDNAVAEKQAMLHE
jgi:hypothetical protein